MKRILLIFILICYTTGWLSAQPCKEVVGYYASWKWYKRNKLVNPMSIDYSKYTIINYAFFKPLNSGLITGGDPWADKNILLGKLTVRDGQQSHDETTSLVYNAHKNQVKIIASVGGWSWSSEFPGIAADEQKRNVFANSCVDLIRTYNLDGIDIDWEFPGSKIHNGSPADKKNFTLLLQAIREEFNRYQTLTGKTVMLTAAFGPAPVHLDQIEWDRVIPLLDIIHIMTYNYYGAWDKITNHNTPLYPGNRGNPAYAISSTIRNLISIHRVPPEKITLGLAFFGRSVIIKNPELNVVSQGVPDHLNFEEDNGTPSYYNIAVKAHLFNRHWDATAITPYMTGKSGVKSFVSYDDPESISIKAEYALKMQLRGVVIWDISGDYMETFPGSGKISGTPLADAVKETFCTNATNPLTAAQECNIDLLAYPNPFRDEIDISWNQNCFMQKIVVRNGTGQTVYFSDKVTDGKMRVITTGWTPGWYIIQLLSSTGTTGQKVFKM